MAFLTANDMAEKIELLLNLKDAEFSYEDSELSAILNTAQEHFKKQFISKNTNNKREGFQETEFRGWGFGNLISEPTSLTASASQLGVLDNGKYWDLPNDFSIILTELPTSDKNDCKGNLIIPRVEVITHDEYIRFSWNYYKWPFLNTQTGDAVIWRMYGPSNKLQTITDGSFTIPSFKLIYLKLTPDIVVDRGTPVNAVDCVLHPDTHETLVEMAVKLIKTSNNEQSVPNKIGLEQIN